MALGILSALVSFCEPAKTDDETRSSVPRWITLSFAFALLLPAQQVSIEPQQKAGSKQKQQPAGESPQANIRVDTTVVLVPVSVNDKALGRPVSGLEKGKLPDRR